MNLSCLPAQSDDIESLFELNRSLIEQYEDLSSISLTQILPWVRRKLTERLPEYRAVFLGSRKVGYFRLFDADDTTLEVDDLFILAPYRRQGIASEILRYCIAESERCHKPLSLYVFTQNMPALHLYEKIGFEVQKIVSPTRQIMIRYPTQSQHS